MERSVTLQVRPKHTESKFHQMVIPITARLLDTIHNILVRADMLDNILAGNYFCHVQCCLIQS